MSEKQLYAYSSNSVSTPDILTKSSSATSTVALLVLPSDIVSITDPANTLSVTRIIVAGSSGDSDRVTNPANTTPSVTPSVVASNGGERDSVTDPVDTISITRSVTTSSDSEGSPHKANATSVTLSVTASIGSSSVDALPNSLNGNNGASNNSQSNTALLAAQITSPSTKSSHPLTFPVLFSTSSQDLPAGKSSHLPTFSGSSLPSSTNSPAVGSTSASSQPSAQTSVGPSPTVLADSWKRVPIGAIIGGISGGLTLIVLLLISIFCAYRDRRAGRRSLSAAPQATVIPFTAETPSHIIFPTRKIIQPSPLTTDNHPSPTTSESAQFPVSVPLPLQTLSETCPAPSSQVLPSVIDIHAGTRSMATTPTAPFTSVSQSIWTQRVLEREGQFEEQEEKMREEMNGTAVEHSSADSLPEYESARGDVLIYHEL